MFQPYDHQEEKEIRKLSLQLTKHYAIHMCAFLTLASCSDCFTPGERAPSTNCIGGWVGPRATLGVVEKETYLGTTGNQIAFLSHLVYNPVIILIKLMLPTSEVTP
jgi:hypothetical protein